MSLLVLFTCKDGDTMISMHDCHEVSDNKHQILQKYNCGGLSCFGCTSEVGNISCLCLTYQMPKCLNQYGPFAKHLFQKLVEHRLA